MIESEVVKKAVVLVPVIWIAVVLLAGWIVEEVKAYRSRDLFKDEEAQYFLKHYQESIIKQQKRREK